MIFKFYFPLGIFPVVFLGTISTNAILGFIFESIRWYRVLYLRWSTKYKFLIQIKYEFLLSKTESVLKCRLHHVVFFVSTICRFLILLNRAGLSSISRNLLHSPETFIIITRSGSVMKERMILARCLVNTLAISLETEWSTLIAREASRYCALFGWDHGVAGVSSPMPKRHSSRYPMDICRLSLAKGWLWCELCSVHCAWRECPAPALAHSHSAVSPA